MMTAVFQFGAWPFVVNSRQLPAPIHRCLSLSLRVCTHFNQCLHAHCPLSISYKPLQYRYVFPLQLPVRVAVAIVVTWISVSLFLCVFKSMYTTISIHSMLLLTADSTASCSKTLDKWLGDTCCVYVLCICLRVR